MFRLTRLFHGQEEPRPCSMDFELPRGATVTQGHYVLYCPACGKKTWICESKRQALDQWNFMNGKQRRGLLP